MALNLSTLTSSATSGDVLAEALTTADFLENVPVLRNLARGSQKGGDAKQDVALNQPKALPLIKNPQGKLGGYLYIPDVVGNYATGPSVTIGSNQTWEGELDMVITQWGAYVLPMGGGVWDSGFGLIFRADSQFRVFSKGNPTSLYVSNSVNLGTSFNVKYGYNGTEIYADINGVREYTATPNSQSGSITHNLQLNQQAAITHEGNYGIQKAKLTVNSSVVFDCDFNGSTSIRHGDTKFQASVGGPVVLNQSGNDPATVIKKSVLRFDGVNDGLNGLFNQTFTEGYMFAAFSVLGNGGEFYARLFTGNNTGGFDYQAGGFAIRRFDATSQIQVRWNGGSEVTHSDVFNGERGDLLLESPLRAGDQRSKINNADADDGACVLPNPVSSEEFNIGTNSQGDVNACLDLEFLALFSADSVPDEATANKIRDYINKRNQIYLRHQTDGFFFFDPQKLAAGDVTSWNGNITGSDLGDTDVATNVTIVQGSQTSQPNADGYSLTFEDNTQHLEWASAYTPNFPAGQTKAWQIVGTSLGTFAYLTQGSVTELNLLGNAGNATYRKAGDLYGIILLPESASSADIEAAKRLLIDRGASESFTGSNLYSAWYQRGDIVEFKAVPMQEVTNIGYAFASKTALVSFPAMSFPALTYAVNAWQGNTSMSDFGAIQAPLCTNFTSAWQSCSALTSFPAGAKLGTEATGTVIFDSAWNSSGITSFSTPLPTATSASVAWGYCSSLTEFNLDSLPLILNASQAWRNTGLTSFDTNLPSATSVSYAWYQAASLSSFGAVDIKNCNNFTSAWQGCAALTSFPSDALLGTEATNVNFNSAWRSSGLTSFSTPLPTADNLFKAWATCLSLESFSAPLTSATLLNYTWNGCTALDSFSSELSSVVLANNAWQNCTSLTDFSADVFANWNPSSITTGVFNLAWDGCTALTAQSVGNILQSIDASNQHGTDDGTSTGNPLGDSGIDIDYDGTTLSAATNTAVTSLKSKGWSIIVNNVTL